MFVNHKDKLKWVSLIVLVLQTSTLVLFLRFSRTQRHDGELLYLSSTAVVTAEIIKFFSCLLVVFFNNNWNWDSFTREIYNENFKKPQDVLKVSVPAFCYVIQNNLLFFALSKLDAATYQVTYQLKILTTAFFAVIILYQKLTLLKWFSLILLMCGVALVQLFKVGGSSNDIINSQSDKWIGLFALLVACILSGFSGVYLEKIIKGTSVSLWMKNSQLAFFSIFGGFLMIWLYDFEEVCLNGFFQGYNWIIWVVVLLQAYGGILISIVVKYADNILKGFAVSLSILLSSFFSWQFLNDFSPTISFLIGATMVVGSTFLYSYEPKYHAKNSF